MATMFPPLRTPISLALLVISCWLFPLTCGLCAGTVYVAAPPVGSAGASGMIDDPVDTIQRAVAIPGASRVIIRGGVYR